MESVLFRAPETAGRDPHNYAMLMMQAEKVKEVTIKGCVLLEGRFPKAPAQVVRIMETGRVSVNKNIDCSIFDLQVIGNKELATSGRGVY